MKSTFLEKQNPQKVPHQKKKKKVSILLWALSRRPWFSFQWSWKAQQSFSKTAKRSVSSSMSLCETDLLRSIRPNGRPGKLDELVDDTSGDASLDDTWTEHATKFFDRPYTPWSQQTAHVALKQSRVTVTNLLNRPLRSEMQWRDQMLSLTKTIVFLSTRWHPLQFRKWMGSSRFRAKPGSAGGICRVADHKNIERIKIRFPPIKRTFIASTKYSRRESKTLGERRRTRSEGKRPITTCSAAFQRWKFQVCYWQSLEVWSHSLWYLQHFWVFQLWRDSNDRMLMFAVLRTFQICWHLLHSRGSSANFAGTSIFWRFKISNTFLFATLLLLFARLWTFLILSLFVCETFCKLAGANLQIFVTQSQLKP